MNSVERYAKSLQAPEIAATLAGRRFGLCGFDSGEARRIGRVLDAANAVNMSFDERLLSRSAEICDAMLVRFSGLSADGLQAAALSPVPIVVMCSAKVMMEGASAAYSWCSDFLSEPWSETELLLRLFRLFHIPGGFRAHAVNVPRPEPVVVLADDDPEWVALASTALAGEGIVCKVADNGLSALRLTREIFPNLVVLDVRMPHLDGFEVLETFRLDPGLKKLPVMLLTGCDDASDVKRAVGLQADDYLTKPVKPGVLLNRVKRLLVPNGATRTEAKPRAAVAATLGGLR